MAYQWYKSSRTRPPFWTMALVADTPTHPLRGCFEFSFAKDRRIRQAECSSFDCVKTSTLAGKPAENVGMGNSVACNTFYFSKRRFLFVESFRLEHAATLHASRDARMSPTPTFAKQTAFASQTVYLLSTL